VRCWPSRGARFVATSLERPGGSFCRPPRRKRARPEPLPIGADLRAVLSLRKHAPDGTEHGPSAFVFGDEVGGRVRNVRRQWEDAVLQAHGHEPTRKRGKLTAEVHAHFKAINLNVHDLRREFASRLLESSAALHDVQMFLGHAAVTTTSRYLKSTPTRLARALDNLERAAFAHGSHTASTTETEDTPAALVATASNSLN